MVERQYHDPVLLEEAVSFLLTDPDGVYVDGTVGGGGHTEEILRALNPAGRLIGFDVDAEAIAFTQGRLGESGGRATLVQANFRKLRSSLTDLGIAKVSGILLDLGISSFQIDRNTGGFSYRTDALIDMRMDRDQELTGWDVVNSYDVEDLSEIIRNFGEERYARRIARKIVSARPVDGTVALRDAIGSAVGPRYLNKTLARVFQAIRIEVNHELSNLEQILNDSIQLLAPGGRIVVISYHSLEDRIVKWFFRNHRESFAVLTRKPVVCSEIERRRNPRGRSAKLRAAERQEG